MGSQSRTSPHRQAGCAIFVMGLLVMLLAGVASGQASTPLLLPAGLAYDSRGNLYFSDTSAELVRKLTPGGTLTIVAGSGTQGFSGDGSTAAEARLDGPGAVAVDSAGNVYFADTHNHRIRRVDTASGLVGTVAGTGKAGTSPDGFAANATMIDTPSALVLNVAGDLYYADVRAQLVRRVDHATGLVTTVAGGGVQGFSGDGGPATAASLDSPAGLALDAGGNLFVSDAHNQRVRRVDAVAGIITTVAGGNSVATLRLPRGLTVDAAGNLFIVDSGNHQIRRVDAATGQVGTVAGGTAEGFLGDGGPASQAALDMPRGVALSASGLATFTDSENARVRQVDANGVIHTIAGVGAVAPASMVLSGPSTAVYGSGSVTATLANANSGSVVLLDGGSIVGSGLFVGGAASFSVGGLKVGAHTLTATFAGDATHGALVSNLLALLVTAAPVTAMPDAVTQVYGLAVPSLTGTLTGVLAQDAGAVQAMYGSSATALSGVGVYPITATITGPAAANYGLTTVPAVVTISKAGSMATLTSGLLAHVGTSTAGQPGGNVSLLDGGVVAASAALGASGDAQFSMATLSNGSHTLTANYGGDANFAGASSAPVVVTIGPAVGGDFSIASAGLASATVSAGSSAVFSFSETPVNGGLASQIVLSATGLPAGATATFAPAYLPPGNTVLPFTLTVQTIKTAGLALPGAVVLAGLVGVFLMPRRRGRVLFAGLAVMMLAGCGDRVNSARQGGAPSRTYNITVNATAASNTGVTLLHSANVTLTID